MSIYVEILVRAPMDALWAHTHTPALHEQWDLRFSKIDYLPRREDGSPQRFRYATRIGLQNAVRIGRSHPRPACFSAAHRLGNGVELR